jgi:hypothetical protein
MRYIKKYNKFFEAFGADTGGKLNDEVDIYRKYLKDNHQCSFSNDEKAYEEDDKEYVALLNFSSVFFNGMIQCVYNIDIDEWHLFINLYMNSETVSDVIEKELSIKDNLLSVLRNSEERNFVIQIVCEVLDEQVVVYSSENIYTSKNGLSQSIKDGNRVPYNMYVSIMDMIKFSDIWYRTVPIFVKLADDSMIKEWWEFTLKDARVYSVINLFKKKYKLIWKKINSLMNYSKSEIDKSDTMGGMGFGD